MYDDHGVIGNLGMDAWFVERYLSVMESYKTGVRRRVREMMVLFAQVLPVFVVVSYISTLEKALVATVALFSIWTAVSARWDGRDKPGFWWLVSLVAVANVIAIWAIPINFSSASGHAVAYPLGMAEGFFVYWLLGWWSKRSTRVR